MDSVTEPVAVWEYARQKHFSIDQFLEVQVSTRRSPAQRRIEELLEILKDGDRLGGELSGYFYTILVATLNMIRKGAGEMVGERRHRWAGRVR